MHTATETLSKSGGTDSEWKRGIDEAIEMLVKIDRLSFLRTRALVQLVLWAVVANVVAWIIVGLILWRLAHNPIQSVPVKVGRPSAAAGVWNGGGKRIHGQFAFGTVNGQVIPAFRLALEQDAPVFNELRCECFLFQLSDAQVRGIDLPLQGRVVPLQSGDALFGKLQSLPHDRGGAVLDYPLVNFVNHIQ